MQSKRGKGENGKEKCGWMKEPSAAGSGYTAGETEEKCNMENAARGSGARRRPLPHESSGPAPACGQQPCGMAWAAATGDDEGLRILLIQRRRAAMSPGQRHCSLPGAWRARARVSLARSTCSLWLCCSRCGMMQSRPAPSLRAWPRLRAGGGEADGVSAGGGKESTETSRGASRPARGAATAGCTGGRAVGRPRRRRRDARRGSLRPARLAADASSSQDFDPRTPKPPGVAGTPLLCRCDGSPSSGTAWNRRLSGGKSKQ